jgi:RNA polymerase sigma-70 factor (ECF subfamily)
MTPGSDDSRLITRIASRDEAALRLLIAGHQTRIFRFIARLVRSEAVAEELTNEVFLDVWKTAGRFEGRSSPSTWLLAMAHNKAVSALRKRREASLEDDQHDTQADPDDDPEISAQKSDKAAAMRRCIDRLSPEHRAIVDLVYYHEASISEAAVILAIPENTVKTRMFYARKRLSELLLQAGIDRGWP